MKEDTNKMTMNLDEVLEVIAKGMSFGEKTFTSTDLTESGSIIGAAKRLYPNDQSVPVMGAILELENKYNFQIPEDDLTRVSEMNPQGILFYLNSGRSTRKSLEPDPKTQAAAIGLMFALSTIGREYSPSYNERRDNN